MNIKSPGLEGFTSRWERHREVTAPMFSAGHQVAFKTRDQRLVILAVISLPIKLHSKTLCAGPATRWGHYELDGYGDRKNLSRGAGGWCSANSGGAADSTIDTTGLVHEQVTRMLPTHGYFIIAVINYLRLGLTDSSASSRFSIPASRLSSLSKWREISCPLSLKLPSNLLTISAFIERFSVSADSCMRALSSALSLSLICGSSLPMALMMHHRGVDFNEPPWFNLL